MELNKMNDLQTQKVDLTLDIEENSTSKDTQPKTKKSKVKKILLYIFGTLGVLLLLYIILNVICMIYEKHQVNSYDYGTAVNVNGHKMNINTVGESNEPTIVFLTGYIVPSPVIYYKPLTELLSKTYKVITIEPFGYGLSDIVDEERTIEKIVPELHSCIEQLNLKNYYLMAHSLGGMYSLYYANQYPNEVTGFIGFDTTVPKINGDSEKLRVNSSTKKYKWFNFFGLNRMMSLFNHSNLIIPLPVNVYDYSDKDISMFRNMELAKGSNKNIIEEGFKSIHGIDVIDNMKFPKNMTLIHFDSSRNTHSKKFPNYEQLHIDVGSESLSNEVIELEGNHGDFLFKHNDEIVSKLNNFIKK